MPDYKYAMIPGGKNYEKYAHPAFFLREWDSGWESIDEI